MPDVHVYQNTFVAPIATTRPARCRCCSTAATLSPDAQRVHLNNLIVGLDLDLPYTWATTTSARRRSDGNLWYDARNEPTPLSLFQRPDGSIEQVRPSPSSASSAGRSTARSPSPAGQLRRRDSSSTADTSATTSRTTTAARRRAAWRSSGRRPAAGRPARPRPARRRRPARHRRDRADRPPAARRCRRGRGAPRTRACRSHTPARTSSIVDTDGDGFGHGHRGRHRERRPGRRDHTRTPGPRSRSRSPSRPSPRCT